MGLDSPDFDACSLFPFNCLHTAVARIKISVKELLPVMRFGIVETIYNARNQSCLSSLRIFNTSKQIIG